MERIAGVATGAAKLRVLTAGERLALALPVDRRAAAVVIDLYRPQRWLGRLFHLHAAIQSILGMPRVLGGYQGARNQIPEVGWLAGAARAGTVGFLGCNPNHGLRCVLAGVIPEDGTRFVAKLGFDQAAEAIRREHDALVALHPRFAGVIQPVGFEAGGNWAMLRLPYLRSRSPKQITEDGPMALLASWLHGASGALGENPWVCSLLEKLPSENAEWIAMLKNRVISKALIHGDFAVWNLRVGEECLGGGDLPGQDVPGTAWDKMSQLRGESPGMIALDWEWAEVDGVAGVDLVHALRQEAYMVRKLPAAMAIDWMREQLRLPICQKYLEQSGWSGAEDDLLRLGLLHSHFNAINPSEDLLAALGLA
jgi:hypothetical protein